MIGLLLAGLVGFRQLPVAALPQVDYPTIVVSTYLPGRERRDDGVGGDDAARAAVRPDAVARPDDVACRASAARRSRCSSRSIATSTPPSRTCRPPSTRRSNLLPRTLPTPPTYSKSNPADTPILTLERRARTRCRSTRSTTTPTRSSRRRSRRCRASASSRINGGQKPAVRVQVDPAALAGAGLDARGRARCAIVAANVNQPKGNLDGAAPGLHARHRRSAHQAPRRSGRSIIAYKNGAPVRLRDVADVDRRRRERAARGWAGTASAPIILNVQRQPGANVIQVADRVKALLPQLQASLPAGHRGQDPRPTAPRRCAPRSRTSS